MLKKITVSFDYIYDDDTTAFHVLPEQWIQDILAENTDPDECIRNFTAVPDETTDDDRRAYDQQMKDMWADDEEESPDPS